MAAMNIGASNLHIGKYDTRYKSQAFCRAIENYNEIYPQFRGAVISPPTPLMNVREWSNQITPSAVRSICRSRRADAS